MDTDTKGAAGSVPAEETGDSGPRPLVSRRTVLRGASAALPTILTLSSGAALARSSNLIGTIQQGGGGSTGEVLCLDPGSTQGPAMHNPNLYDLGSPPYGEVTSIPTDLEYRTKVGGQTVGLTPDEVCLNGGEIEYKLNGWSRNKVLMNPGAMVSSAAVSSFGNRIITTGITDL